MFVLWVTSVLRRDGEDGLGRSPPPPFIDTRRGGVHVREGEEVAVFSPNRGTQWTTTAENTLWGTGDHGVGRAVVLSVVLSLAEIAPASLRLQRASW